MKFTYLLALIFSISSLLLIDKRFKLAFFLDTKRAAKTIVSAVSIFLIWDILGIWFDIFFPGNSKYDLDILILPKVPVEELFFLFLLSYVTLIVWRLYAHVRHA